MLQSERIRVIGLILVLSFLLIVIAIRALFGGVPEQLHLLPRFTALMLASTAYESLMLRLVSRAIQTRPCTFGRASASGPALPRRSASAP